MPKNKNCLSLLREAQNKQVIMTAITQTPTKPSPSKGVRKNASKTKIVTPPKNVPDNPKISDPYDLRDFFNTLNMKPTTLHEAQDIYVQCYRAVYGTTPRKSSYDKYDVNKLTILLKAHVDDNEINITQAEYQLKQTEARALLPQKLVLKASIMYHNFLMHNGEETLVTEDVSEEHLHKMIKKAIIQLRETDKTNENPVDDMDIDDDNQANIVSQTQDPENTENQDSNLEVVSITDNNYVLH